MTPLQKLLKSVEDLGKLIVAKGLKNLPKVQKIAQSGHTDAWIKCSVTRLGDFYKFLAKYCLTKVAQILW